jgi:hypothetical protein
MQRSWRGSVRDRGDGSETEFFGRGLLVKVLRCKFEHVLVSEARGGVGDGIFFGRKPGGRER